MTTQVEDRDVSATQAAELFGIPADWIHKWRYRGYLTPSGILDGRGRTGRVPLYRLSEVAKLIADRHAARS